MSHSSTQLLFKQLPLIQILASYAQYLHKKCMWVFMQSPYCSLISIKTIIHTKILIKLPNIKATLALTAPGG
jgi:hypothetical protein